MAVAYSDGTVGWPGDAGGPLPPSPCASLGALVFPGGTATGYFSPGPFNYPTMNPNQGPAGLADGSTGWDTVGSNVPVIGSPFSYGVILDRGATPSLIGQIVISNTGTPCTAAGCGITLDMSSDGAAWTNVVDWVTMQTYRVGAGTIFTIPLSGVARGVRYLRSVITDQFGPGAGGCYGQYFFDGPGWASIQVQACIS